MSTHRQYRILYEGDLDALQMKMGHLSKHGYSIEGVTSTLGYIVVIMSRPMPEQAPPTRPLTPSLGWHMRRLTKKKK